MAALVGVIAHRCWDQIIGNLRASAGDESPAREYPAADISTRPSRRPGMMLTNAILQRAQRMRRSSGKKAQRARRDRRAFSLPLRSSGLVENGLGGCKTLGVELVHPGPFDVPGPAQLLEDPDQSRGDVDLSLQNAVTSTARVGVVRVVPRLTEDEDGQGPEVGGLVARVERTVAHHV